MVYRVMYSWQGERFVGSDFPTYKAALACLREFRAKKWISWVESI